MAPEWWGLSGHAKEAAEKLAQAGYAALAMDLYGEAKLTDDAAVANEHMSFLLNNPEKLHEHTRLALQALQSHPSVEAGRTGAAGFCFGGKVVLDMARRGEPLKGVVSFHGNLTPETPAAEGAVQGEILIEHGEEDTLTTMDDVAAFRREMDQAKVSYRVDVFPGAKHGFTNPQATENGRKNQVDFLEYGEDAARESWQNALAFFARVL